MQRIHQHLVLNKYKLKDALDNEDRSDRVFRSTHMYEYLSYIHDDYLNIYYYDTGEEFTIPYNLLILIKDMDLNDYYPNYKSDEETDLGNSLVILHTISNHFLSHSFIKETFRYLFKTVINEDVDFKPLRDEVYELMDGVIVGNIVYSSPSEYKFY